MGGLPLVSLHILYFLWIWVGKKELEWKWPGKTQSSCSLSGEGQTGVIMWVHSNQLLSLIPLPKKCKQPHFLLQMQILDIICKWMTESEKVVFWKDAELYPDSFLLLNGLGPRLGRELTVFSDPTWHSPGCLGPVKRTRSRHSGLSPSFWLLGIDELVLY